MKEELQSKLVEILTSIQTAAGKASDFAMEQLPDVAQSYVIWARAYMTTYMLGLLVALSIAVYVALRLGYLNKEGVYPADDRYYAGQWKDSRTTAAVVGTGASILLSAVALVSSKAVLLVWLAPKVWLLKEIATLLK